MRKNEAVKVLMPKEQAEEAMTLLQNHKEVINRIFNEGINIGIGYEKGRRVGYFVGAATVTALIGGVAVVVKIMRKKLKNRKKDES